MSRITMFLLSGIITAFALPTHAAVINATSVTSSGAATINNNLSILTDGTFPTEWSDWNSSETVWWEGNGISNAAFTFDLGANYVIKDLTVSLDNNDTYHFDYSTDGSNWLTLIEVDNDFGSVLYGMDTFSSDIDNSNYDTNINFSSVIGRYLRVYAVTDGGDALNSIGEVRVLGNVLEASAVPEPSSMLLLGAGLPLIGSISRKYNRRKQA